jgi:hypothetical protein
MWYFLSLYLQGVLGDSALKTGPAFLPMGVTIMIGAQASSRILPRVGVRPLLQAGTLLAGVAVSQAGLTSGVLNTARQIGGSLGLAVLATIATNRTRAALAGAKPVLSQAAALNDGYSRAFEVATALTLAAFAASFVVPAIRARTAPAPGARPKDEAKADADADAGKSVT